MGKTNNRVTPKMKLVHLALAALCATAVSSLPNNGGIVPEQESDVNAPQTELAELRQAVRALTKKTNAIQALTTIEASQSSFNEECKSCMEACPVCKGATVESISEDCIACGQGLSSCQKCKSSQETNNELLQSSDECDDYEQAVQDYQVDEHYQVDEQSTTNTANRRLLGGPRPTNAPTSAP